MRWQTATPNCVDFQPSDIGFSVHSIPGRRELEIGRLSTADIQRSYSLHPGNEDSWGRG
jgi:hypothetical protein